jgi:hypothetical protein
MHQRMTVAQLDPLVRNEELGDLFLDFGRRVKCRLHGRYGSLL